MGKIKIHINLSAGLSGVVIQKCSQHNQYSIVPWNELNIDEQQKIAKLFSDLSIVYNNNLNLLGAIKKCTRCNKAMPLSKFYKRLNSKGVNVGSSICKKCSVETAKKRNKIERQNRTSEDIQAEKEYQKEYYESHKTTPLLEHQERKCKYCVYYKNCFPEEYKNESDFASNCKKYRTYV